MIKTTDRYKLMWLSILLSFGLLSCGYSKKEAEKYLPGQYYYEIPTGEFQVLKINLDFSFEQLIYSKNKKDILYENKGTMYVDGNKIECSNWLECYELADQKMLLKPYITYSMGNYWRKPQGGEGVLIIKFDQANYIFRKKDSSPL